MTKRKPMVIAGAIVATLVVISVGVITYAVVKDTTPTPTITYTAPRTVTEPQPPTVKELLKLVNAERKKVGVAPLVIDERLNKSAQRKSDEMVKENRFEHTNKAGVQGYLYAHEVAPECLSTSENFTGADDSKDAMSLWLNSVPHKKAILDTRYETTGLGVTQTPSWYMVVEHFCDLQ